MRRRLAYVLAALTVLGLSAGLIGGCKQKEGERCQINDDCASGLVCNTGTGTCQHAGAASVDAVPPPDAVVDSGPIDATPPIDSATTIDSASTIDATLR
jgi:hypothetical protein